MAKRKSTGAEAAGGLFPLSALPDVRLDEDKVDVRGWPVRGRDGILLGQVRDLIVERASLKARYLDVVVDHAVMSGDRRVLVPVGVARVDERDDVVRADITADTLRRFPEYRGTGVTRDYETSLRARFTGGADAAPAADDDFYAGPRYDERGLSRNRPAAGAAAGPAAAPSSTPADVWREGVARMTIAEEQLALGRRRVQGEVAVRKTVETEHVQRTVPVQREEIVVERRPLPPDASTEVQFGEDEIRIPLVREELVVEKRAIPVEEIVIRKVVVSEDKTVEADLRREQIDESALRGLAAGDRLTSDRPLSDRQVNAPGGGASGGLADRVADRADDLKDRVDGNPASRPGPDATDRPGR